MDPSLLFQMLTACGSTEEKSPWPGLWEKDQGANPRPEQGLPSSFGAGQVGAGCFKPPQPSARPHRNLAQSPSEKGGEDIWGKWNGCNCERGPGRAGSVLKFWAEAGLWR